MTAKEVQTDDDLPKVKAVLNAAQVPKKDTLKEGAQVDVPGIKSNKGPKERDIGEYQNQGADTFSPVPTSNNQDDVNGIASEDILIEAAQLCHSKDSTIPVDETYPFPFDEPTVLIHSPINPAPLSQSINEAACVNQVSPPTLDEPNDERDHSDIELAPLSQSKDEAAQMSQISPPALDEPSEKDHSDIEPAPLYQSNDEAAQTSKISPPALDEPSEKDHPDIEPAPLSKSNDEAAQLSKIAPPALDEPSEKGHSDIEPAPLYQSNDEAAEMSKISTPALDEPSEKGLSDIEPAPLSQSNDEAAQVSKISPPALDEPCEKDHSDIEPAPLYQPNDEAAQVSKISPPALDEPSEKDHSDIEPAPLSQSNDEAAQMSNRSTPALDEPSEKDHSDIEPAPLYQSNDEAAQMSNRSTPALDEPSEKDHSDIEPAPLSQSNDEAVQVSKISPPALDEPSEKGHSDIEPAPLSQSNDEAVQVSKISPPALDEPSEKDHSDIEPAPLPQSNDEAAQMSKISTPALDEPGEKDKSAIDPSPLNQSNDEAVCTSQMLPTPLDEPSEKDHSIIEPSPSCQSNDEAADMSESKPVPFDEPCVTDSPTLEVAPLLQCTDDKVLQKAEHFQSTSVKEETAPDEASSVSKHKDENPLKAEDGSQSTSFKRKHESDPSATVNHASTQQTTPSFLCEGNTVVTKAKEYMSLDIDEPNGKDSLSLDPAPLNECTGQSISVDDTKIQPLPVDEHKDHKTLVGPQPVFTDYGAAIKRLFTLPIRKPGSSKLIEIQTPTRDPIDDEPLFLDYQKKWLSNYKNHRSQEAECNLTADEVVTNLFKDESDFSLASIPDSGENSPLPTARQSQKQLPNDMIEDVLEDALLSPNNKGQIVDAAMENERVIPHPTSASNLQVPGNSSPGPDHNDEDVSIQPEGMEHEVSLEPIGQHPLNNNPVQIEFQETRQSALLESSEENCSDCSMVKIPCCSYTDEECETGNHEKQMLPPNDKSSKFQDNPGDFQTHNQDALEKEALETKQICAILSTTTSPTNPQSIPGFAAADEHLRVSQHTAAGPTCQTKSQLALGNGNLLEENVPGSPRITRSTPPSVVDVENAFEAQTTCQNQNWSLPNTPLPDYEEEILDTTDDEISQFDPYDELQRGRYTSTPIPNFENEDEDPYGQLERRRYNSTPIPMLESEVEDRFAQLQRRYQNSEASRMLENEDENIHNQAPRASWMQHPNSPDMASTAHSYTAIMPFGNEAQDDTSREETTGQGHWKKFKKRVRNTFRSIRSLFTRKSRRVAPLEEPMEQEPTVFEPMDFELEREMFLMEIDGQWMICYEADLKDDESKEITKTIVPVGPYEPPVNLIVQSGTPSNCQKNKFIDYPRKKRRQPATKSYFRAPKRYGRTSTNFNSTWLDFVALHCLNKTHCICN
eukprot:Seg1931.4 transcript_id=Seg1931.4/GoldUCD/mRNA.D3Y31 product="hypothetical protein" protein_id=Seg1931.4/GoldUCD/D3Y31